MATILTAAEMRALEQAAIARGEVTGLELMERAGRGVVEAILAEWPGIEDGARRAVVLCGPGNNGGDGFVVARLLRERGWAVEAWLHGEAERLPPDARANHDRWAEHGPVRPLDPSDVDGLIPDGVGGRPSLWVDALFGIGLTRPLSASLAAFLAGLANSFGTVPCRDEGRVVAVDVPSGLDADTGLPAPAGTAGGRPQGIGDGPISWFADLTVTFQTMKPGHLLARGPDLCGRVAVVDLGLRRSLAAPRGIWSQEAPARDRLAKRAGHKYGHGHAVVLGGGPGKGGAARMSARGALRIGAGLVTLAVPPAALQENAAALDAIMLRSVRDAGALAGFLADDRHNALGAGPGLGLDEGHGRLVAALLALRRPTVLDADALTLVSRDDALRAALHEAVVLTPHGGEFKRLFPGIDARWRDSRLSKVDAAREAAREAGCVVLLKGPDTVIADPSGRAAINAAVYDRAAPWLATAGSGDVLAGFIAGLLARGFAPFEAACTAAWLHVECARSFGPGLVAEDLPEELPRVFRALGL